MVQFGGSVGQRALLTLPLAARGLQTGLRGRQHTAFALEAGVECRSLCERVGQEVLVGLDGTLPRLEFGLGLLQTQRGLVRLIAGAFDFAFKLRQLLHFAAHARLGSEPRAHGFPELFGGLAKFGALGVERRAGLL